MATPPDGAGMVAAIEEFSIITCPICGAASRERMPTDACLFFYECTACKTLLKPKAGDCCVFCSYGSLACPPVQLARAVGHRSAPNCRAR